MSQSTRDLSDTLSELVPGEVTKVAWMRSFRETDQGNCIAFIMKRIFGVVETTAWIKLGELVDVGAFVQCLLHQTLHL